MSETPVAIETYRTRRIIFIIASVLLLLALSPVQSQIPSPSKTPIERSNPRGLIRINPPTAGETAIPTNRRQPPFPDNALSRNIPRSPTPTVTPSAQPNRQILAIMTKLASAATLRANPPSVEVNQKVQFELVFPQPPPPNPTVQYRFYFDDGHTAEWLPESRTVHPYASPGTHRAFVVIRVGERLLRQNTFRAEVEVRPRSTPTPSGTASVTIKPSPYSPSPTAVAPGGFITATPPGSSNSVASPTATGSSHKHYTASPTPIVSNGGPPPGKASRIYYIVSAGLAILMLTFLIFLRSKSKIPMAARPAFHPHSDWEGSQRSPENVAINYELHFDSNVSSGQNWLETGGPILILRKTKQ